MIFRSLIAALTLAVGVSQVHADTWPSKPIRFVVAAPAGSSLDVIARTVGEKLRVRLGQPIIVENMPSAAGVIATGNVAKAAPDGYTMLLSFNGPLAFAQYLSKLQ
jgi:tripartite-type tricarboxylate transporter receptor subunit TctC